MRTPLTWLIAALAGGALLAGCGGGSGSTASSQSSSTPATTSSTPAATSSTPTATAPSGITKAQSAAIAQQAAAACRQAIQGQPSLSAAAKGKLEATCTKVGKGDTTAVHKAVQEICAEIVNGSALPPGPAREHAIAGCRSVK
jgi:hypothetical protein